MIIRSRQDSQTFKQVATALLEKGIILIIDEAFMDFLKEEQYSFIPYLAECPNVIVVRSLTKFYAIPGLRLGYAVSYHPTCLLDLQENRAPWTVNTLADTAVPVMLADKLYQEKTRDWLEQEKTYLFSQLCRFSCLQPVHPSVNYLFF